jgi:hypothetical protein
VRTSRLTVLAAAIAVLAGGAVAGITPAASAASGAMASARPATPAVPLVPNATFRGVAVVSRQLAWAVGNLKTGDGASTRLGALIMRWDGSTWARVPSPAIPGAILSSVTAPGAASAWAVGTVSRPNGNCPCRALTEHWDGTAWKQVASPHPAHRSLTAVSAVSARSVWAVGTFTPHIHQNCPCYALIEHWDGTRWKQVPSPHPVRTILNAVAAVSARSVWAVGSFTRPGTICPCHALIEHWNGATWKEVPAPAEHDATFLGVAALSARDAWAVGSGKKTLIEHWNGTRWKRVPAPGGKGAFLSTVAAGSARSAWAAGATVNGFPRLEHWNGRTWSLIRPQRPGTGFIGYGALAASSARNAWAVGTSSTETTESGLILHWDGTTWK